jgi:hypothetical protein
MTVLQRTVEMTCWWSTSASLGIFRSAAAELVSMNDLWDVVFPLEPGQERLRGLGISVPLKENLEHQAVLVHRPTAVWRPHGRCSG